MKHAKTKPKRFDYVCSHCGSRDVKRDAYCAWDTDSQGWYVSAVFDKGAVCEQCGGETTLKEILL